MRHVQIIFNILFEMLIKDLPLIGAFVGTLATLQGHAWYEKAIFGLGLWMFLRVAIPFCLFLGGVTGYALLRFVTNGKYGGIK